MGRSTIHSHRLPNRSSERREGWLVGLLLRVVVVVVVGEDRFYFSMPSQKIHPHGGLLG